MRKVVRTSTLRKLTLEVLYSGDVIQEMLTLTLAVLTLELVLVVILTIARKILTSELFDMDENRRRTLTLTLKILT